MMYRTPMVFVFIILLVAVSFGQKKEITEREFWNNVDRAREMAMNYSHRKTRTEDELKGKNVLRVREWINELVLPDYRKRWITISNEGKKTSRTEQIEIGSTKYCKKDDGPWVVKDCTNMTLGGGGGNLSESYTSEEVGSKGRLIKHIVYHRTFDYGSGLRFDQFECWIDKTGRIMRELSTYGDAKTKKVLSKNLARYEYDPKGLKIEAPMK